MLQAIGTKCQVDSDSWPLGNRQGRGCWATGTFGGEVHQLAGMAYFPGKVVGHALLDFMDRCGMPIRHAIEGMDQLAIFGEDEDEDVAGRLILFVSTHQRLNFFGSIFRFAATPTGDDERGQRLLHLRVAETTASEMIGTGSGVAGEEIATCGDIGDPEQCHGPVFLLGSLFGLFETLSPVELEEFELA